MASVARASAGRGLGVDLLAGREVERRVAAEAGDGVGAGAAADGPAGEGLHLGVDALDLGEAGRGGASSGARSSEVWTRTRRAVRLVAARDVAQAGALRRAGGGQDLGHQDVVEAREGRADPVGDGVAEVRGEPVALAVAAVGVRSVAAPPCPRGRRGRVPGTATPRPGSRAAPRGRPRRGRRARSTRRGRRRGSAAGARCGRRCSGPSARQRSTIAARSAGRRRPLVVRDLEEVGRDPVERVHVPGQRGRCRAARCGEERSRAARSG